MSLIINSYSFGGYTARTTAFLAATGITDTTIVNALNTMDLALIANGLDTKMKAYYPFVGGTASTHKWNFMNAVDSDAAFRLTFSGGWTHSSTGAKPNGSTGYAQSYYIPSVNGSVNSEHLSYYSRTNVNNAEVEIGCIGGGNFTIIEIRTSNVTYLLIEQSGVDSVADTDSRAYYLASRTAPNAKGGYRNGVSINSTTTASVAINTYAVYLGAYNNTGTAAAFSTKECALATIGTGLNATDSTNLYNLVNTFQTSLSRNV